MAVGNKDTIEENIMSLKSSAEAKFVGALYNDLNLAMDYKISVKLFSNKVWQFYYALVSNIVKKKKVAKLEHIELDTFISELQPKFRELYEQNGGWETIKKLKKLGTVENVESSYNDINKYAILQRMLKRGFPVEKDWQRFAGMTTDELEQFVLLDSSSIFNDINTGDDKVVDLKNDMTNMIAKAHKGVSKGLEYASPLLNGILNGMAVGNIGMLAGQSGIGKSFLTFNLLLPKFIEKKEPVLIMVNEEGREKWQQELITYVINNIIVKDNDKYIGYEFVKSRFYQGKFSNEERELLSEATEWIQKNVDDGLLNFCDFETYAAHKAIKQIRKYAMQGVKYFIIDTMKLDNDVQAGNNVSDKSWLQLQQNMVKIYNTIKETNLNVFLWVTYQMGKGQRFKFLSQSSLGMSKNVADVVSSLLLVRHLTEKEKESLYVERNKGKVELDKNKDYMVVFIDKNRRGSTSVQVVLEVDKGRNIIRDVGITRISEEF